MVPPRTYLQNAAQRSLAFFGLALESYNRRTAPNRARFIAEAGVNLVLDVGASEGRYAAKLRQYGYRGRIESFEPGADAYSRLEKASGNDPLWSCRNLAVGSESGSIELNISRNCESSSLLEMEGVCVQADPSTAFVATEKVHLRRLDSLSLRTASDVIYLKADVQGFERHVVEGAAGCLDQIALIELELSIIPLYKGQPDLIEMIEFMRGRSYELIWLERVFRDARTGYLLQVDGIFARRSQDLEATGGPGSN